MIGKNVPPATGVVLRVTVSTSVEEVAGMIAGSAAITLDERRVHGSGADPSPRVRRRLTEKSA
jgi:hypothetical protein